MPSRFTTRRRAAQAPAGRWRHPRLWRLDLGACRAAHGADGDRGWWRRAAGAQAGLSCSRSAGSRTRNRRCLASFVFTGGLFAAGAAWRYLRCRAARRHRLVTAAGAAGPAAAGAAAMRRGCGRWSGVMFFFFAAFNLIEANAHCTAPDPCGLAPSSNALAARWACTARSNRWARSVSGAPGGYGSLRGWTGGGCSSGHLLGAGGVVAAAGLGPVRAGRRASGAAPAEPRRARGRPAAEWPRGVLGGDSMNKSPEYRATRRCEPPRRWPWPVRVPPATVGRFVFTELQLGHQTWYVCADFRRPACPRVPASLTYSTMFNPPLQLHARF